MTIKCDVLVIGAGPAGLETAITTSKAGLKTIVVEKSSEIGYPVKTSALTWASVIDQWKVSKKAVCQGYNKFYIKSLHTEKEVEIQNRENIACTLNFHEFLRNLFFKCVSNKTEFIINQKVSSLLVKREFPIGVKLSNGKEIHSKIIVDASGPSYVAAKQLGFFPREIEIGIGAEYEFHNAKVADAKRFDVFFGHKEVIPVGYGWSFPVGKRSTRIGVATSFKSEKPMKKNINHYLEDFLENRIFSKMLKEAQPIEYHMGAYPVNGLFEKLYSDNLLIVGDAGGQANPLFGEGIRYALTFGELAGKVASDALKRGDTSSDFLSNYQLQCEAAVCDFYSMMLETSDVPTNAFWDHFIEILMYLKQEGMNSIILKIMRNEISSKEMKELHKLLTR